MRKKGFDSLSSKRNEEDKVIAISSEYFEEDRPSYICSICNQTLIRLTDAGMNNTEIAVLSLIQKRRMSAEKVSYQYLTEI